jgi:hypothetical protein
VQHGDHRHPEPIVLVLLVLLGDVADVQRGELGDHRQGDGSSRGRG